MGRWMDGQLTAWMDEWTVDCIDGWMLARKVDGCLGRWMIDGG